MVFDFGPRLPKRLSLCCVTFIDICHSKANASQDCMVFAAFVTAKQTHTNVVASRVRGTHGGKLNDRDAFKIGKQPSTQLGQMML